MDEPKKDFKTGSVSFLPSLNSNDNDYAASVDDLAWADSCLIELTEASDADWSSFKESLLEILNVPTEPVSLLGAYDGNNDHIDLGDNQTFPSGESLATAFSMLIDDHSDFSYEDEESQQNGEDEAIDEVIHRKKKELLKGKIVLQENALLPVHTEFANVEISDLGINLGSLELEVETSHDIFKVWDLGVSDEQDEFAKDLNKALEEPQPVASISGVTEGQLDFTVEPLDDLVAGISELSLGQSSN